MSDLSGIPAGLQEYKGSLSFLSVGETQCHPKSSYDLKNMPYNAL